MEKIKLGISTCLLGENVRYDGGHRLDRFVTKTLRQYVEYVPVCPEVECGLGVPREPMHLEGDPDSPQLVRVRTRQDVTARLIQWGRKRVIDLEKKHLWGFIFKSDSPSCGMERVKVFNEEGRAAEGVGLFATMFTSYFPLLPIEDERRLHDPKLRDNFIERIFVLKRWREVVDRNKTLQKVVDFHTGHKLLILSKSPKFCQKMGQLVSRARDLPLKELYPKYQALLMKSLSVKTSLKKNADVLQHMTGYFKKQFSCDEEQELAERIHSYRKGHIPLIVPLILIKHFARKYDQPYLEQQVYLNPHPLELRMRNHV